MKTMPRTTNLRDMEPPDVASGAIAGDTVLAETAHMTPSEKGANELNEYKTPAQPKSDAGGKNQFK